jgi:asparagine synthase (glutamine-hydrolysing)
MSGIAALLRVDGPPAAASLQEMLAAMAHRGPDGEGAWDSGVVGLGHLRLAGTAHSYGQPVVRGQLAATADCRLDNRDQLMRDLGIRGGSLDDGELILRAYERWGAGCAGRLMGDFAFVVWDGLRRAVVCARDHFGVKPLYYHRAPGLFAAASEVKGLFAIPEVPRQVDEQMLGDHLTGELGDPEITYWRDIRRLPAAHTMVVQASGRTELTRYWQLDPEREIRLSGDGEYAEALRTLFTEAVSRRLPEDEAIGAALSGGLDSTSVATVAALSAQEPVHSFSARFSSLPTVDEGRWINPALQGRGFIPHMVSCDEVNPFALLDRMLAAEDGIFYAPNLHTHWALFEEASRSGVRVYLDGFDGDSTLSHGTSYPRELLLRGHWRRAGREVRALAHSTGRPFGQQASRLLGVGLRTGLRRISPGIPATSGEWDRFGIVAPRFAARLSLPERHETLGANDRYPARREREAHLRQLGRPLNAHLLEVADRAAAAHGVEPRYPFMDVPLAEFCLALPGEQKLRAGWTRWVMRRAMEGILPPVVQWRQSKSDWSPVLPQATRRWGQPMVDAVLRDPEAISPYVDVTALRRHWARFRSQPSSTEIMPIWLALILDRGLRHNPELWPEGSRAPAASRVSSR